MGKLKSYQEQVQETLQKALSAAEEQHRQLAAKPFDFAEKLESEAKELSVKSIRNVHDKALDNMYSALNSWNSRVSDLTADIVTRFDKEEVKKAPVKRKAPAKRASSAKPAAKKSEAAVA